MEKDETPERQIIEREEAGTRYSLEYRSDEDGERYVNVVVPDRSDSALIQEARAQIQEHQQNREAILP